MATKAKTGPAIYVAHQAFSVGGVTVPAGSTIVAGHPLMKGRAHLFRPFQPTFGVIPAEPAEPAADAAPAATEGEAAS